MRRAEPGPSGWVAGLLLAFSVIASVAVAAAPAADEPVLDDYAVVLPLLPPVRREQLRQRAAIWSRWSPVQRAAYVQRAVAWQRLPAAERGNRRERYLAWQALPPAEQAQVRAMAALLASGSPQQRQALRAQFDALDRSARRGWLLGPVLGADYTVLQPLLAQLPASEHAPMLGVLRAMSAPQRAQLAVLVQRTPPQEREALRRDLLSTSSANRDGWLQLRLDQ